MAKVIIFGIREFASLAHIYLNHDSSHEIIAFTVTEEYMPVNPLFEGLPVVPFEKIEEIYSPKEYVLTSPMSFRNMNSLREKIFNLIKGKGYPMISYVSSKAVVSPNIEIGDNCWIRENNVIMPFVKIGNNLDLMPGCVIGHHSIIKDHVFFGPGAAVCGHCTIDPYSIIGANSSLREGVHIGEGSFIAMSACVAKDTEPWSVYAGVPAKKVKTIKRELSVVS